jgi:hypothetical protein
MERIENNQFEIDDKLDWATLLEIVNIYFFVNN